jgi:hypothetical protein
MTAIPVTSQLLRIIQDDRLRQASSARLARVSRCAAAEAADRSHRSSRMWAWLSHESRIRFRRLRVRGVLSWHS